jgi:hypothetical protein
MSRSSNIDPELKSCITRLKRFGIEVFLYTIRCLLRLIVLKPVKLVACIIYQSTYMKLLVQLTFRMPSFPRYEH